MPDQLEPPLPRFCSFRHYMRRLNDRWVFRQNFQAHRRTPRWGHCMRCYITWNRRDSHPTFFSKNNGISALCSVCFNQLAPAERLPYYADMMRIRISQAVLPTDLNFVRTIEWADIRAAVLEGK